MKNIVELKPDSLSLTLIISLFQCNIFFLVTQSLGSMIVHWLARSLKGQLAWGPLENIVHKYQRICLTLRGVVKKNNSSVQKGVNVEHKNVVQVEGQS